MTTLQEWFANFYKLRPTLASSSSDTMSTQTWVFYTGLFLELSFSKSGGVHDSYTFQCGLVGSFTSHGIDTR